MSAGRENGDGGKGGAGAGERAGRLGFAAHEIRNPLSTALWSAELLGKMAAADRAGARGEKMVAMLVRSLGRVRQLVEDHFLSERLDVGGIPLRAEPLALRPVLEGAAARKPADTGPLTVEVGEAAVLADPTLLDRAIDALVAAAGRDGSAVIASARREAGRTVLRLEGAPISAEALADPSKGAPSDPRGRALAVPLARRIAAVLGGELRAERGGLELSLPAGAPEGGAA